MTALTIRLDMIDFPDGSKGVALFLPEEAATVIGMDVGEASRLVDALLRIVKLAYAYNEARVHGAVGPMQ